MVRIIEQAVFTAKEGKGVSQRASKMHLFADSAEGTRVQMDKTVAVQRTGDVMRRLLKSD